jgi:hypothetical protein
MKTKKLPITLFIAIILIAAAATGFATIDYAFGQFGMTPVPTEEKVLPTYIVRIPPAAAQQDSPEHYYPPNIAIPAGTTIAWFNDDQGQPHTVTSDPTGSLFNSGIMPYSSFFQYTFAPDQGGEFTYHCEIHPWRVGKISVSNAVEQGNNFILTSGTGSVLSLSKNDRTLLNFKPTTVTADETTPLTYNITMLGDGSNEKVFSTNFFALGGDLQVELVSVNNTNTTTTTVYGPDFSDPITGAYHIQGNFLKPDTDYKITAEITAVGSQILENRISDTFNLRVTS